MSIEYALKRFAEEFVELNERKDIEPLAARQLYSLCTKFNEITGGTLSPYNSPKPVVVMAVPCIKDGKKGLLGIKRGIKPVGGIALVGGFVDENESAEQAAFRELVEETMFDATSQYNTWDIVWTRNSNNNLLLFMKLNQKFEVPLFDDIANNFTPNDEVIDLVFIEADTELCFEYHQEFKDHLLK